MSVATKGYRRNTRDKFSKPFRGKRAIIMKNYLTKIRAGDYVDVKVDSAIHKGMPYKYYHGRTGRVFNVNPRSVGVSFLKPVRSRYIEKRIHMRIEHVRLSQSRVAFVQKIKENDLLKAAANKAGKPISTKRLPEQPRTAHLVCVEKIEFQNPKKYRDLC